MLSIGDKFPEFSLTSVINGKSEFETISNTSYKGKWLVVFSWPKDFTFVCPTEMVTFGQLNKDFEEANAKLLGFSTDNEFVHQAWLKDHKLLNEFVSFPMMSDIKRELSSQLGIIDKDAGVAQRATYIVNPEGEIKFVYVTDLSVGRDPKEVLRVLNALQTGELCPASWSKGKPTL